MIPRPHIAELDAYALADMTVPAGKRLVSLAQNESLRPPSPLAIAAVQDAMLQSALYPDPDWTDLRAALSETHHVPFESILCGAGSLDLIAALARVYTGPGRALLAPAHAYPFFRSAAALAGARFDTAPERDGQVDIDALLAAVTPETGLVCVANPGNPTGTWLPPDEIDRLRAGLPPEVLLLVDEAYGEFAPDQSGAAFNLVDGGRTVVTRTFSKAYGLAGLRVGWGLFPKDIAAQIRKVLNPNNISAPAQAAARAALDDSAYMRETVALTAQACSAVQAKLRAVGYRVQESQTNFFLIDLGSPAAARALDASLRAEGVFLRGQAGAGLPHMLRMTLGAPEDVAIAQAHLVAAARG